MRGISLPSVISYSGTHLTPKQPWRLCCSRHKWCFHFSFLIFFQYEPLHFNNISTHSYLLSGEETLVISNVLLYFSTTFIWKNCNQEWGGMCPANKKMIQLEWLIRMTTMGWRRERGTERENSGEDVAARSVLLNNSKPDLILSFDTILESFRHTLTVFTLCCTVNSLGFLFTGHIPL